jgi:hypothetical protein
MHPSFSPTARSRHRACRLLFAILIPPFFAAAPVFAESVAMVYVIGEQKLQIMASDIAETHVGQMREFGDPVGRPALRICFNEDVHAKILEFVTKNLRQYDHFELVIDCKVAVNLRITAFDGLGNCNFIYDENPYLLMGLERDIKSGMTKSTCEAYVS